MSMDLAYFDSLSTKHVCQFAAGLTGKRVLSQVEALRIIARILGDPAAVRAWVQALPAAALAVLEALAQSRGYVMRDCAHGALRDGLGHAAASAGLDVLEDLGVVFELPHQRLLGCIRPLMQAVAPLFDATWAHAHAQVSPDVSAHQREAFALQVLLGHLQSHPVRLTRSGQMHARDAAALHQVFSAWRPQWIEQAVAALRSLGAVSPGEGDTLSVRSAALVDAERLDAAAWYVLLHKQQLDGVSGAALRYFVRRPGMHPLAVAVTHLSLLTKSEVVPRVNPWAPSPQPWLNDCLVRRLLMPDASRTALGLAPAPAVALQHAVLQNAFASLSQEAPAPVPRCFVQPNLEIIAPPDLDFATLMTLTRWCEVQNCDTVATLRITASSVQRAVAAGNDLHDLQACLAACARHGVSDNVRRTVADFGAAARAAYVFDGLVVVSQNEADALRAMGPLIRPTRAPGTFRMVAPRGQVLAKLKQAGLSPVDERAPKLPSFTDARPPLVAQAQAFLEELVQKGAAIERCLALPPLTMPAPRPAAASALATQDCG